MAFFSSGHEDIVCLGDRGQIMATGKLPNMMALAEEKNYAVGRLIPVRYSMVPRALVPALTDSEYADMVNGTRRANEELLAGLELPVVDLRTHSSDEAKPDSA